MRDLGCPSRMARSGRVGPAVTTVVGHHRPEVSALGGLSARIEHWRAGFIDEDAVRLAQMSAHVVDDGHQVEAGATDPVAERAPIQIDPLPVNRLAIGTPNRHAQSARKRLFRV